MTFLFSDIEDSARLWEEGSAEITASVEIHDSIVRGTIDRHGGYLFADDDDGFAAAFSTAVVAAEAASVGGIAVLAAKVLQRTLRSKPNEKPHDPDGEHHESTPDRIAG